MIKKFSYLILLSLFLASCGGPGNDAGTDGSELAAAKLSRLDGQRFIPIQREGNPEYYILYYSASW